MCAIVKMGRFLANLIFDMDETEFSGSGYHLLCLGLGPSIREVYQNS
jgi:hypothetical protein